MKTNLLYHSNNLRFGVFAPNLVLNSGVSLSLINSAYTEHIFFSMELNVSNPFQARGSEFDLHLLLPEILWQIRFENFFYVPETNVFQYVLLFFFLFLVLNVHFSFLPFAYANRFVEIASQHHVQGVLKCQLAVDIIYLYHCIPPVSCGYQWVTVKIIA